MGLWGNFLGGLVLLALGVRVLSTLVDGLVFVSLLLGPCPGRLTEYGPAVAGLAVNSGRGAGRNFVGRIGATDKPPWATVVDSGRILIGASEAAEAVEEDEIVLMGEKVDMADPGLAGRFFVAAIAAFF